MSGDFHDRDEQLERIRGRLHVYQRRYAILDVPYQYRIWVLDTLAKGRPSTIEFEYDWQKWLEREKRRAEDAGDRVSVEEAFTESPQLTAGFRRMVAAFRQDSWMSVETARVYAEEFGKETEADFNEICSTAIRTLKRFPLVADLNEIREAQSGKRKNNDLLDSMKREDEQIRADEERVRAIDEKIAALPEEERRRLEDRAREEFEKQDDFLPAMNLGKYIIPIIKRRLYVQKHPEEDS